MNTLAEPPTINTNSFENWQAIISEAIYRSGCNLSTIKALHVDYRVLRDNHGRVLSLDVDAINSVR